MTESKDVACTCTDWNTLSPVAKALVRMFAVTPIWALNDFREPSEDLVEILLSAAWNRSGFDEQQLRANPEAVVRSVKKLVAKLLRPY